MSTQLERLAKPFPKRLIHENPSGGGSYVKHSVVTEKLLAVLGPFSFELVQIVRGHVAAVEPNPQGKSARAKAGSPALDDCIVGAVCRLRVVVDSVPVSVEEVGDCESPNNWPHDGARLKDAMSDALKRAAMRLGVTLHLWSGAEFSLYEQLRTDENAEGEQRSGATAATGAGSVPGTFTPRQAPADPPSATSLVGQQHEISPAGTDLEHSTAANGSESSSPSVTPGQDVVAQATIARLKARAMALQADGLDLLKIRTIWNLPALNECTSKQLELWQEMLTDEEKKLTAPFVGAS